MRHEKSRCGELAGPGENYFLFSSMFARTSACFCLAGFDEGIRNMGTIRREGWRIAFADQRIVLLSRP